MFIASKLGQTSQSELLECEFEWRLSRWKRQTNFFQVNALLSFGVRLPFLPLAFFKVSLECKGVLATRLALYHEDTSSFSLERFIFIAV